MNIFIIEGSKLADFGDATGIKQGETMGTFNNANKTPMIDGQMVFEDTSNSGFYTYNVNTGGMDKVDLVAYTLDQKRVQLMPGGYYYFAHRLDALNCNVYNQCGALLDGVNNGSYYSARQNINLYNDDGSSYGTLNAATEYLIIKLSHGYTKVSDIVTLSGSSNVSIRVSGKANKTTKAVTLFPGTVWAADTYKGNPSIYRINTY